MHMEVSSEKGCNDLVNQLSKQHKIPRNDILTLALVLTVSPAEAGRALRLLGVSSKSPERLSARNPL